MVLNLFQKKLFSLILWFSKISTPDQGPHIPRKREDREENWWGPLTEIPTEYGFHVDSENSTIQYIDRILKKIPIWDEEPTILPIDTARYIEQKYQDRIPKEVTRPESLDEFLWSMTGSYFLERSSNENIYLVDLSSYEEYPVRDGFEKYGGKVYLKEGRIIRYEYCGQIYHPGNSWIEKIIRATLCLKMMVEMHALRIHLGTSQRKTFEYRANYNLDSPLVDFLYLSTYGRFEVNRRIPILVGTSGLVARLFALTPESYSNLLQTVLEKDSFDREEILGTMSTAWNQEMRKYLSEVQKFIKKILPETNFQEMDDLSDFFTTVTALHNQFGDAQIYSMAVSDFFLPKIYQKKPGYISKLDRDLLSTLLVSVSPRFPLLNEDGLEEVFQDPSHREAWKEFVKNVTDEKFSQKWFNPRYFETSVGF